MVGTPRRRCPKHQAQRAVSGIQRRLHPSRCATTAWQVRRERRTATARHPYHFLEIVCIEVIVSLQLDFAAQKKGAWPSRPCGDWSTFLAPCPLEPSSRLQHTGGASGSARRAVSLYLNPKASSLFVFLGIWDDFRRPLFDVGEGPIFYEVLAEE